MNFTIPRETFIGLDLQGYSGYTNQSTIQKTYNIKLNLECYTKACIYSTVNADPIFSAHPCGPDCNAV